MVRLLFFFAIGRLTLGIPGFSYCACYYAGAGVRVAPAARRAAMVG